MIDPARQVALEEKLFRLVSSMTERSPDDPLPPLVQRRLQARVDALHSELEEVRAARRAAAAAAPKSPEGAEDPGIGQQASAPPDLSRKIRSSTGRDAAPRSEPADPAEQKVRAMLPKGKRGKSHRRVWG